MNTHASIFYPFKIYFSAICFMQHIPFSVIIASMCETGPAPHRLRRSSP